MICIYLYFYVYSLSNFCVENSNLWEHIIVFKE